MTTSLDTNADNTASEYKSTWGASSEGGKYN